MVAETLIGIGYFIVSIILLFKGSDLLTEGASRTAKMFGVSDFVIGVTIVAIGTSLPELASTSYASYIGKGTIVLGDVLGSNITNIALVLGIACIIKPIEIRHIEIYSGWVHLLVLTLASGVLVLGSGIGPVGGFVFIIAYFLYLRKVIRDYGTIGVEPIKRDSIIKNIIELGAGFFGVILGARLLVNTIISFTGILGIPEFTISLLIMAFGTSVPEITTTLTAARKGYSTMAFGGIIGSNIANILWVLGIASIINRINVDIQQILPAIIMMLLLAVFLISFRKSKYVINRKEGIIFVTLYSIFIFINIALI